MIRHVTIYDAVTHTDMSLKQHKHWFYLKRKHKVTVDYLTLTERSIHVICR